MPAYRSACLQKCLFTFYTGKEETKLDINPTGTSGKNFKVGCHFMFLTTLQKRTDLGF